MKKIFILTAFIILPLLGISPALSQKMTVGFLSGINLTKPNGNLTTGKWAVKNGPITGAFFNYGLSKVISLQTEFNYTVINYSHKGYNNNSYYYPYYYSYMDVMRNSIYAPYYNDPDEKWEFSFTRIPIYLKISTPTKLKLELAVGGYFSFRQNYEVPQYPVYPYDYLASQSDMLMAGYNNGTPPKRDAGYFYSVGLSYPIAEKFNVFVNGRYFSGRRTYIESVQANNGVAEITFGLGYCGFFKYKNKLEKTEFTTDSAKNQLTVTVKSGIGFSENSGTDNNNMYSGSTGFSSGLSFMYHLSKNFAFQSDLLFERKGYRLKGQSNSLYKYTPGNYYTIDNKVDIDYVTIPFLMNLQFGKKFTIYFEGGFYLAMLMNAKCTGTAYYSNQSENSYQNYKKTVYDNMDGNIKSNDWGWVLGSGIQYPILKKYKLDLDFRYNTGMSNIYVNKDQYTEIPKEDTEIKNKSYVISLGFQIPIN